MLIPIDEVVFFDIATHHPSTAAVTDADSTPTFSVFEEDTDTAILAAQNFTKRTSFTGNYRGSFTASTANGFEAGKWYNVIASATVNSIAAKGVCLTFRVAPAETTAGVPQVRASAIADGAISASTLASDTITDAKVASDVTIASVTGSVGSVTAGVTLAASAVQAIWDALTSALSTVGSIGKLLVDNLNATISSRLASASYTAPLDAAGTRTAVGLASANLDTQLGDLPTNAELATALDTALDATVADSIPADGSRPSVRQALYMLTQFMLERSVSSTTVTVKKPDGSSSLFTLTLNDATTPTSITRAT